MKHDLVKGHQPQNKDKVARREGKIVLCAASDVTAELLRNLHNPRIMTCMKSIPDSVAYAAQEAQTRRRSALAEQLQHDEKNNGGKEN